MKLRTAFILLLLAMSGWVVASLAQDRGLSVIAREVAGTPNFVVGKQYAVIIGIDRYQDWMPLKSAVKEAKSIRTVLADRYYIDEFIELYDDQATAGNIRRLFLDQLPRKLDVHDSVLIFYAGHGYLDASQTGFWIPVDGSRDIYSQTGWIPNNQLRNYINQLKAQRILVIADSCFSGDFLNTSRGASPIVDSAYFRNALTRVSRQVLSSGASETVPDESEFGRGLLGFLQRNSEPVVDTLSIYDRIRLGVSKTLPLFGTLPGNENGASFVLFLKQDSAAPAVATVPAAAKGRLELLSDNPAIAATAVLAGQGSGVAFPISNGSELAPGNYRLSARLADDSQDTWNGAVVITEGHTSQVKLPKLDYSPPFQLNRLSQQRSAALATLQGLENGQVVTRVLGWTSLGLGVVGTGLGLYGLIDGPTALKTYNDATVTSEITAARRRTEFDSLMVTLSLPIGALGLGASPFLLGGDDAATAAARQQVELLDQQIQALNQGK